jgi:hypothetical protein
MSQPVHPEAPAEILDLKKHRSREAPRHLFLEKNYPRLVKPKHIGFRKRFGCKYNMTCERVGCLACATALSRWWDQQITEFFYDRQEVERLDIARMALCMLPAGKPDTSAFKTLRRRVRAIIEKCGLADRAWLGFLEFVPITSGWLVTTRLATWGLTPEVRQRLVDEVTPIKVEIISGTFNQEPFDFGCHFENVYLAMGESLSWPIVGVGHYYLSRPYEDTFAHIRFGEIMICLGCRLRNGKFALK